MECSGLARGQILISKVCTTTLGSLHILHVSGRPRVEPRAPQSFHAFIIPGDRSEVLQDSPSESAAAGCVLSTAAWQPPQNNTCCVNKLGDLNKLTAGGCRALLPAKSRCATRGELDLNAASTELLYACLLKPLRELELERQLASVSGGCAGTSLMPRREMQLHCPLHAQATDVAEAGNFVEASAGLLAEWLVDSWILRT